jgi:hypothetical protein
MTLEERIRDRLDAARALAIPIKELSLADRPLYAKHLLELGAEDRYLRFGNPLSDETIERYVRGIDFDQATVFGIFNDNLKLVAAGHFAPHSIEAGAGQADRKITTAEFGLSVAARPQSWHRQPVHALPDAK